jgi:catechol 2,3-dioxygenase-like lactoylglutathione lyase family enzyme
MTLSMTQDAIDLGIVITDSDRSLAFYRDLLGFRHERDIPMPIGSGTMHRLRCGSSLIKLVRLDEVPGARPPGGGIDGGTGYRYFTIHCDNLAEMVEAARENGVTVPVPPVEIRPGVTITMLEDPDGNWVELIERRQ